MDHDPPRWTPPDPWAATAPPAAPAPADQPPQGQGPPFLPSDQGPALPPYDHAPAPAQAPGGYPPYGHPPAPYPPYPPYPPYGGQGYQYGYGYGPQQRQSWVTDAPADLPYHRMARTVTYRWWRPIVGTLFLCAAVLAVIIGIGIIGYLIYAVNHDGRLPVSGNGDIFPGNPTAELAFELVMLAALTPAVLLSAWVVRRRPGALSSVAGRLRWRWLGTCCLLSIGFLVVSYGWGLAVEEMFSGQKVDLLPAWKGWHQFIAPAIVIVVLVPFQATAEEYLFRGWLIQAIGSLAPDSWLRRRLGRWIAVWPALAVSAVVFMLGHGYTGWARLDVFLFGLLAGWLAVRTGGLEAGIALHAFNNLYAFLLPAAAGQLVDAMNQGGSPWWAMLSDLVPLVLYAGAVLLMARARKLRRLS